MFKPSKNIFKFAAIFAVGLAFNLIGLFISTSFHLPFYFDTVGTAFIAAFGGYLPGIALGLLTNVIGSLLSEEEIYYGIVNILVAIIAAAFANKGYYKKFSKVIMIIPLTVVVTSLLSALIGELLSLTNSFDSADTMMKIGRHILKSFSYELPDKTLAILLSFFALKLVPSTFKDEFSTMGKMQAPISSTMRQAIDTRNNFILSLRTKMIFTLMSITLLVAVFISAISYKIYQDSAVREQIRIADGIITMAIQEIDPKRIDEFIDQGHNAKGYKDIERQLYRIRASNSDIKYLYVYKIMEDGCHVVFDLETAGFEASKPGDVEEFEEAFEQYLPDLLAGRPIPPIISDDTFGHLLTIYKPVYDSMGNCTCYAGIDFSMDLVYDHNRMFIGKVITMFSSIVVLIFALGLWFVENNIILPVKTMAWCARNFAYDSEEARAHNIEYMKSLGIRTNDEIENLYSAFLKTTSDSMHYFENLRKAKIQVAVMEELAHTDSLTGLRNKTSYAETTARLDKKISDGTAEFCIAMIDVNYLKRVNDTYGHERGNEYLINAGKLACSIFGTENVYRIGGDEFVAVLVGEEAARGEEFFNKFRRKIEKLWKNSTLQPWEKISAAIGLAHYEAGVDMSAEEVFKRADERMYANKLAMKATRKD